MRRARNLRRDATVAERKLWYAVRAGRPDGWKCRRRVPIGRYIVDFPCLAGRLVVELDGGQHNEQVGYDAARTRFLEERGHRVTRVRNNEVLTNIEGATLTIWGVLSGNHPLPSPSPFQGVGL